MNKLIGVCIGAGYFSQFHYEAWSRIESVKITAICDVDLNKARAIAEKYNIKYLYTDVSAMFEEQNPDFVDIITPPKTHLNICLLALNYGINIICQKPLAPTLEEAEEIKDRVFNSGNRLMVHENFRFQPWHREIKKLLNQKIIGDNIFTISVRMRMGDGWQDDAYLNRQPYFRKMERLLVYETGIHFIDVFRYLIGEIESVNARLKTLNKNIIGEDFAWVHFEFDNDTLGFLDASRYNESTSKNPRLTFGYWQIDGNKGTIRLYEDGKITIQKLGSQEIQHYYNLVDQQFSGDCVFNTQTHFIDCLISGKEFETNIIEYIENIKIQEAIYKSSLDKQIVKI